MWDAGVPSQNTRPPSILMSVDLIFDQVNVKDAFMLEKLKVTTQDVTQLIMNKGLNKNVYTVQPQTNAFVGMLMSEATRTVTFQWMDLNFTGEVSEVQARYTMFSTSGRPIRSIVRLSLQQKLETAQAAQKWSTAFDSLLHAGREQALRRRQEQNGGPVEHFEHRFLTRKPGKEGNPSCHCFLPP